LGAGQSRPKCITVKYRPVVEAYINKIIEDFKNLKSFVCKCPSCGKEKEIFSDEFDRKHHCAGCGKEIDFSQCAYEAGT